MAQPRPAQGGAYAQKPQGQGGLAQGLHGGLYARWQAQAARVTIHRDRYGVA